MSAAGPAFRGLGDIQALERTPYAQAIPARTTWGLIQRAAAEHPDREALRFLPAAELTTPPERVTYRELATRIAQAANLFRSLGAGPEDAVVILAPNIPATQYALWGAQIAARACPINYLLQPEHIAALLQACGAKLIVALAPHGELDLWPAVQQVLAHHRLPVLQIRAPGAAPVPGVPVFDDELARQPERLVFEPALGPDRIAAYFHTGGTTGAPKLAQHTHGNEAHTAWFAHRFYDFDERTVEINGFPLFHVAGAFVYGLALMAIGATQVLPTVTGMRNAAFVRQYWRFCERERVTALACVPTILATLLNQPVDADISSVRVAYTGGSPLPAELATRFEAERGIAVRNILGMTECAGLVSIEPAAAARVAGSVGLRLPYTEVAVVPWRDGQARLAERCAAGQTGVVALRGPHVSPGYTDAARNAGMFEGEWLVSGDLGHLDEAGHLHITGRAKDVIIRGSHNLDPGLIEEAFLAHPAVALCAVVAEPDAYAGELPVAFVTLRPGAAITPAQLLAEVAPQVYERPAVPKRVTVLDALPVTAIGKVYKPALRCRAIESKLAELLADVPGVTVAASEQGGVLSADVRLPVSFAADGVQALRDRLAAIAVPVRFAVAAA